MNFSNKLVERYVGAAILPYMCLTLLLLTAMLLAQQANRFAEVLGATHAPLDLAFRLAISLVPGILIFTVPMATLAGTIIGFSRMGSDSELVALSAAGIGRRRMLLPVLLLGAAATSLTLYCGLEVAPAAARSLRATTLRAALHKLNSPVDLRTFNTEIPGKIIYVRDGDETHGQWGRVFIFSQDPAGQMSLITARSGRIDSSGDQSELVLSDAVLTMLAAPNGGNPSGKQITVDHSIQLRVRLDMGRSQVLTRMRSRKTELDEMNLAELAAHARSATGKQQYEAATEMHHRFALSISPLCFALLGAGLGMRVRRGGRASGVLISIGALLIYYLVSFTGEQAARAGVVRPLYGAWVAVVLTLGSGIMLLLANDRRPLSLVKIWMGQRPDQRHGTVAWGQKGSRASFILGLVDRNLLRSLFLSFAVAFSALVCLFLVFTLLELGRFLSATQANAGLVARYLFFLLPLAGVSLAPVSLLVAILVTYALMARRNEAVAWWAAGQSLYRLALPGLLCAASVSTGMYFLQERLMPQANRRQDVLRAQIRGGVAKTVTASGRQWLASSDTKRVYSYEYNDREDSLLSPLIFDFDQEGVHLESVLTAAKGILVEPGKIKLQGAVKLLAPAADSSQTGGALPSMEVILANEPTDAFKPALNKPSQLNARQLSNYITLLKQRGDQASYATAAVAYERKRSDPIMPFVMLCMGIPLALIYGRRNAITALAVAVGVTLLLWGAVSGFQQLGSYGLLPPFAAAWTPPAIFGAVGLYTLSRTGT